MVKQRKSKEELAVPPAKNNDMKAKPTPEQLRVAQILEKKITDPLIKLKLKQIMDATQRPADEVYLALHDSDFDADQAVDMLIEGKTQDDWCLSKNKKKKVQESKEKKTEERLAIEQNGDSNKPPSSSSFGRKPEDRGKPGKDRGPRNGETRQRVPGDEQLANVKGRGFRGGRGPRNPRLPPGTMVFERSVNQETMQQDQGLQPAELVSKAPLRNQWEKPLISNNSVDEDWDNEEFTGSLSQTQIFTSSLKVDVSEDGIPEEIEDLGGRGMKTLLESEAFEQPQQLTTLVVKPSLPPQPTTAIPAANMAPAAAVLAKPVPAEPAQISNKLTYASLASDVYNTPVSTSLFTQTREKPQEPRPSLLLPARTSLPAEPRSDLFCRLTFPKNLSDHPIVSAKKPPPSKIPTSAVEMPPEAIPSLSHLDIEFGAIDLGPSATDTDSIDSFSAPVSQSQSSSGLILPPSEAQSTGSSQFSRSTTISSSGNTSTSLNNFSLSNTVPSISNTVTQSVPLATSASSLNTHYQQSTNQIFPTVVTTTSSVQSLSGINSHHFMSQNSLNYGSSTSSLGLMTTPDTIPSSSVNHVTLGHVVVPTPTHLTSAAPNHLSSAASAPQNHMLNSSVSPQPVTQTMGVGRYMPSSNQQTYNTHLQYGYMSSQPYDSRPPLQTHLQQHETNTSMPPPHMSQPPPLPPAFKHTPPGIPKGNSVSGSGPPLVANLPPPMVNPNHHQYIGNMPYFSHQPFFYYEEMPPVLNSQQQRLAAHHHMPQGYDTSNYHHPTSNSASNRDGVHYNV